MRTWRAVAAIAAQWRRTSSASTAGQATVLGPHESSRPASDAALRSPAAVRRAAAPPPPRAGHDRARLRPQPRARADLPGRATPLRIRKPGSGPDSLKLVSSGKVELGVLDIHDLAIARAAGHRPGRRRRAGRQAAGGAGRAAGRRSARGTSKGRTVGVSGLPSDPAFLKAIVEHDGGDDAKIKQVTIGFNAVSRLLTKRVDAVPVFWNAEGVALQAARAGGAASSASRTTARRPTPRSCWSRRAQTLRPSARGSRRALDAIAAGLDAARAQPGRGRERDRGGGRDRRPRARAGAARRGAADLRRRPAARPRGARALGRLRRARSGSSRSVRMWTARSTSRCAVTCGAPGRCHRPGGHRSCWGPCGRRLQSRV